jgi:hypothetical protein
MAIKRAITNAAAVAVAAEKADRGMSNTTVSVGGGTQIYIKPSNGQLVVRRIGRSGGLNEQAKALQKCGGKTGGDFVSCLRGALGRAPSKM